MSEKPSLYQLVYEMHGQLTELSADLKNLKENFDKLPCVDQEKRIDRLEAYKNQLVGKVSVISAIFGAIGYTVSIVIGYIIKINTHL